MASITSALLAVGVAEIALRVVDVPRTAQLFTFASGALAGRIADDPELFWKLEPDHPDHNALGLRGPWFDSPPTDAELRILAVGDSCTYGMGVPWSLSWGIQLERNLQLRMPDRLVRTGLAAVPGWSTFQNRRLLEQVLPDTRPGLVVFYCGAWNDQVPAVHLPDAELARQRATLRLGMMAQSLFAPSFEATLAAFERGEAPFGRRVPPAEFRENLTAMAESCAQMGAVVAFVVPTHSTGTAERHPALEQYRQMVREVAVQFGAVVVELEQVARELDPDRGSDRRIRGEFYDPCFLDRVHPGANLHEALARELAAALHSHFANGSSEPVQPQSLPVLPQSDAGEVLGWSNRSEGGVVHRAYLGDQLVDGMHLEKAQFRWRLRADTAPGAQVLAAVTDRGLASLGVVEVPQLPLFARRQSEGAGATILIEGRGEPGRHVWCWLSAQEPPAQLRTRFGQLGIWLPDLPPPVGGWVRFDLAENSRYATTVGPDGIWSIALNLDDALSTPLGDLRAQALVFDLGSWNGALTGVCQITR